MYVYRPVGAKHGYGGAAARAGENAFCRGAVSKSYLFGHIAFDSERSEPIVFFLSAGEKK